MKKSHLQKISKNSFNFFFSFLNVSHWVVELQTHTYTNFPKVILCGNKIDLIEDRKVDTKMAKKLAKE